MHSSDSDGIGRQWQHVCDLLRREFGETAFLTWLKPVELVGLEDEQIVLAVPTVFMRDWLIQHYADRIRSAWTKANPNVCSIVLTVRERSADSASDSTPPADPASDTIPPTSSHSDQGLGSQQFDNRNGHSQPTNGSSANGHDASNAGQQPRTAPLPASLNANSGHEGIVEEFGIRLDPRMTFESFVVGKPNEFAVAAAERVATSLEPQFNPLFLYGGVGLGKTHLMHAIAARAKQIDPTRRVVYLSAEKFMYQFVQALRRHDTMVFKEMFRSVDMLMVDDVQFIGDKDSTQEEFFHTFNTLIERGRQIVISADRSPADLSSLQERIRSRLGWGLCADIHPTTYELRLGILQSKAEQLKVTVPLRVLEFLASRITSNVRELEGALNRIVHHAGLFNRQISLEMAQDILRDQIRSHDRRVTIEDIQKTVVDHYGIRISDMHSSRRQRSVARPRQIAMFLSKRLTTQSLPEIGKKFGNRDHTTVMHAVKKVEELMQDDRTIASDVDALTRSLKG